MTAVDDVRTAPLIEDGELVGTVVFYPSSVWDAVRLLGPYLGLCLVHLLPIGVAWAVAGPVAAVETGLVVLALVTVAGRFWQARRVRRADRALLRQRDASRHTVRMVQHGKVPR